MQWFLISTTLTMTALLGTIWVRVQAHRRWRATIDTYAERELAHTTNSHSSPHPTPLQQQPKHRLRS